MKKTKLLVLVSALLVAVMVLASCGGSASLADYLNADYDTSAHVYTSANKIKAVDDFTFVKSNGYLAVFVEQDEEDITYKLISLADSSVVATFDDEDTTYEFDFCEAALLVTSIYFDAEADEPAPETEYLLYDGTGSLIATSEKSDSAEYLSNDFLYYDGVVYEFAKNGALTKLADVPEYINAQVTEVNDYYFYVEGSNTITVYDRTFNYVSFYETPGYVEYADFYILNNGDILVQYGVQLDNYATKYDFYMNYDGVTLKYDVETLLVSAADGKVKDVKLGDYVIQDVTPNYDLYDADEENNEFTNGFENIIILAPIVDCQIDDSDSAAEIYFMNNKAKLGDSLKFLDDMYAEVPYKVADDVYKVATFSGAAFVNAKGEVLKRITNTSAVTLVGEYFVGEDAIYNADFSEVVYDLKKNDAEVIAFEGDSVFINKTLSNGDYEIILFCAGETKVLFETEDEEDFEFELVEGLGYAIWDKEEAETKYYNAKGEKVFTTEGDIETLAFGFELFLIAEETEDGVIYYVVK